MNSKVKHTRQLTPKTKNGKKINYELNYSFSKNKKKETTRNKYMKEAKEAKEANKIKGVKKAKKAKEANETKEVKISQKKQEIKGKNYEKIYHQKKSNTKNKIPNSNQNKIEEVSNAMIINMIIHNRLVKNKNK